MAVHWVVRSAVYLVVSMVEMSAVKKVVHLEIHSVDHWAELLAVKLAGLTAVPRAVQWEETWVD